MDKVVKILSVNPGTQLHCIVQDPADYWYVIPDSHLDDWGVYYHSLQDYWYHRGQKPGTPTWAVRVPDPYVVRFGNYVVSSDE